ncbi:MAG: hypothetical protein U1E56_09045 [Bauldia sp.]
MRHSVSLSALAVVLGVSGAFAQAQAPGAGQTTTGMNYTTSNVDTSRPFGSIDITKAGPNNSQMSTFLAGLSAADRAELTGRCSVVGNPSNSARYQSDATSFCQSFTTAMNTQGGAGMGAGGAAR